MELRSLKDLQVKGKRVLCRVDLNLPTSQGSITDNMRVRRLLPTIKYLIKKKAKIIILSHFGRPKGCFQREYSLAPMANLLSEVLGGYEIKFNLNCIGDSVKEAISSMKDSDILLLENLRFHEGELKNDPDFVDQLVSLGDVYVNDSFSASHRNHASIVGLPTKLPSAAGFLLQEEIDKIGSVLSKATSLVAAITGGSKISTKLKLLESLIDKVDMIAIGGAMANTFLKVQGYSIGKSIYEPNMLDKAKYILGYAKEKKCEIILPEDVVIAEKLVEFQECKITSVNSVQKDSFILDIGPKTVEKIASKLENFKTVLWNGPLGAFEYRPFDVGTITMARYIASMTLENKIISVVGGGDLVASLKYASLKDSFSYVSTAGGAFLEWIENQDLPGIRVLKK